MDIRVLRSLATCAMYPYIKGGSEGQVHDGVGGANGAEFPEDIAMQLTGVPRDEASSFYAEGFALALQLAAAITDDPGHSPDLQIIVSKARENVSRIKDELRRAALEGEAA